MLLRAPASRPGVSVPQSGAPDRRTGAGSHLPTYTRREGGADAELHTGRRTAPAYNWWNECLHGVGRSQDKVTVFPQAIGLAATFDPEGVERMGGIIAAEARAIYNEANRSGKGGMQYKGLTFWTPNINIFRDPRWGRGQETYGEDPFLTGLLGKAMVCGLQGRDTAHLKVSACAKHRVVAPRIRCRGERLRPVGHLPARIPRPGRRCARQCRHGGLQPLPGRTLLCERSAAARYSARILGLHGLRHLGLRCHR